MTQFNLKKKKAREIFSYKSNNIISQIGTKLVFDKVEFINKRLNTVLVLDGTLKKNHSKFSTYEYFEFDNIKETNLYDGILSNFGIHIPLAQDAERKFSIIKEHLNDNGFFCFNLITINSMTTIRRIFTEIDEVVFNGAYNRFGPFHEVPNIIESLNKNNFKDVVVSTELIELNYESLVKLRCDFKEFGMINIYDQSQKFKRDFLNKTELLFAKIVEKHKYIPVEIEIATFTSWK
jgi:hypothetical protein